MRFFSVKFRNDFFNSGKMEFAVEPVKAVGNRETDDTFRFENLMNDLVREIKASVYRV